MLEWWVYLFCGAVVAIFSFIIGGIVIEEYRDRDGKKSVG